jgi:hypothetical protein
MSTNIKLEKFLTTSKEVHGLMEGIKLFKTNSLDRYFILYFKRMNKLL